MRIKGGEVKKIKGNVGSKSTRIFQMGQGFAECNLWKPFIFLTDVCRHGFINFKRNFKSVI